MGWLYAYLIDMLSHLYHENYHFVRKWNLVMTIGQNHRISNWDTYIGFNNDYHVQHIDSIMVLHIEFYPIIFLVIDRYTLL